VERRGENGGQSVGAICLLILVLRRLCLAMLVPILQLRSSSVKNLWQRARSLAHGGRGALRRTQRRCGRVNGVRCDLSANGTGAASRTLHSHSYLVPAGVRFRVALEAQRGKLKLRLALLLACFLVLSVPRRLWMVSVGDNGDSHMTWGTQTSRLKVTSVSIYRQCWAPTGSFGKTV
jgi:hypothetical protein